MPKKRTGPPREKQPYDIHGRHPSLFEKTSAFVEFDAADVRNPVKELLDQALAGLYEMDDAFDIEDAVHELEAFLAKWRKRFGPMVYEGMEHDLSRADIIRTEDHKIAMQKDYEAYTAQGLPVPQRHRDDMARFF